MQFKAAFRLAEESIYDKQKNRYLDAIEFYDRFIAKYSSSVYAKEAERLYAKAKEAVGRIDSQS